MLRACATTRVITPREIPIRLGGYANGAMASRVDSALEVNCLAVTDGVQTVVIVSLDLLYVTHALRQLVLRGIQDLGIDDDGLFMAASHTHYAPAIDETKPALGEPDLEYRDETASAIIETTRAALQGPFAPVELALGSREVPIGINRRRKRLLRVLRRGVEVNQVGMCPNPEGPTDPIVSVAAFRSGGQTLAYAWSAACHPTGLADRGTVSAHWPGVVRDRLRELEADQQTRSTALPVLFLQGFSGDVRPPSGGRKAGFAADLVRTIRLGPTFEPLDADEYSQWSRRVADHVCAIAGDCLPASGDSSVSCARVEHDASRFAQGATGLPPVSFHRVTVGDVVLLGASAELVSEYAHRLRSWVTDRHVIPVGCLDHVIGYWPTADMLHEGGYEVVHHCRSFGITACDPHIEPMVLQGFAQLLADGRDPRLEAEQ